ncbi:hypothetical protein [Jiella pacifica]|uniref:Uncharacterized protein n=1 Tax=Jiella pacifica TaxID=2696469 RepID=A0A6N9TC49_9HYPH|nr:hypothetical protein [Jiella pacifica]NDW06458.1 hypothetical protein [Jiella pacifica]
MTLPTNEGLEKEGRKQPTDADIEAAKLTATFLNGLAVSLSAVGAFAPIFHSMYVAGEFPVAGWQLGLVSVVCFAVSVALHLCGRSYLTRELRK